MEENTVKCRFLLTSGALICKAGQLPYFPTDFQSDMRNTAENKITGDVLFILTAPSMKMRWRKLVRAISGRSVGLSVG